MSKLEEQLTTIKAQALTDSDKAKLWQQITTNKLQPNFVFLRMKSLLISFAVLVLSFGSAGLVSASNAASPGDALFPIDVAIEKLQLSLAGEAKTQELTAVFAEERAAEIRTLANDLSEANVTSVEVDVFTNETIVKIEANDRHIVYGTNLRQQSEIVAEITSRFSIPETKILAVLDFSVEDRESREADREVSNPVNDDTANQDAEDSADDNQQEDANLAEGFSRLQVLLDNLEDQTKAEAIRKSLDDLFTVLGNGAEIEIESGDIKVEVENEDGELKIEVKDKNDDDSNDNRDGSDNSGSGRGGDDDNEDEDEDDHRSSSTTSTSSSTTISNSGSNHDDDDNDEDEDEKVFCRGELRDAHECDDDDDDDNDEDEDEDDDDDNSGSGSGSNSGSSSSGSGSSNSGSGSSAKFTVSQVATHNSSSDCWAIVNGSVYDLTDWIGSHPGGESAIIGLCGKDGSTTFNAMHGDSSKVAGILAGFLIGSL